LLWESRIVGRDAAPARGAAPVDDGQTVPTKALRQFLRALTAREAPVVLDLGPVVGPNVAFLGERLSCKILFEDLFADLERHESAGSTPFADVLSGRLQHGPASVDGILCWNFFDYLDPAAARVLGSALTRLLRPDGALWGFFTTTAAADPRFMKCLFLDEDSLRQRPYGARDKTRSALPNRDLIRLFDGLRVSESFLLKTHVREFLFRKPAADA
jgi:hypothetical protein